MSHVLCVSSVFFFFLWQITTRNPSFLGLHFMKVCCISPFRIFCAQSCLTLWRVLCRGMSAVCWTPCGWWTYYWCCSLRDARLCPNLQLVLLAVSLVCGVSTVPGNAPTDSLLTVYAAKTPMLSLMPLTLVVSVQVVHERSVFWTSGDFEGCCCFEGTSWLTCTVTFYFLRSIWSEFHGWCRTDSLELGICVWNTRDGKSCFFLLLFFIYI